MDRTKRSQKAVKQMLAVVRYDFRGFFKRPRVILTFLLGFVLCFLLSSRIMPVMETYKSPVQMLEPFLWTFGDSTAILLSSVLLLLLFSDLPAWNAVTPYYLYRTTKVRWLLGQMIYMASAAGIYTLFMLGPTMILCAIYGKGDGKHFSFWLRCCGDASFVSLHSLSRVCDPGRKSSVGKKQRNGDRTSVLFIWFFAGSSGSCQNSGI